MPAERLKWRYFKHLQNPGNMTDAHSQDESLRARLNGETARFAWKELQRFFAAGTVIAVHDELDLIEVALQIANDNKEAVAQWMRAGRLGQVSDAQAQSWLQADAALWTVVVKPWVLVQQRAH
jgi:hypothetical protein